MKTKILHNIKIELWENYVLYVEIKMNFESLEYVPLSLDSGTN